MKRRKDRQSGFSLIEVIVTLVIVAILGAMMYSFFGQSITQSSIPIFRLNAAGELNKVLEKISADYEKKIHWFPGTVYPANTIITPAVRTGFLYLTTGGGTSGTTEPSWPTTLSNTVNDNGITWTAVQVANRTANTSYLFNTVVYPGSGYRYRCTTAGTSGAGATVVWPASGTVQDGTVNPFVVWTNIGQIPPLALKAAIGTELQDYSNAFGSYKVVQNRFITFDGSHQEVATALIPNDTDYGKYLKVSIGQAGTGETLTTLFVVW